ncbi:BMP and activin membrane-bound inhibitor homolog isoform X2 [Narcine bancroftii]|uniref:BMP and activin membrane-bound inhibitor homolog isoform X2 n=1 Tax=Narcine bancroftii TaxID=1343680 RepID=UPI003831AB45
MESASFQSSSEGDWDGEIRCYCDGPQCVATGYMCKSQLSACFTRLLDPHDANSPLLHGCTDTFSNTTEICHSQNSYHHKGHWSLLECCWEDMCNYKGLQEVLLHSGSSMSDRGAKNQRNSGNKNLADRQKANAREIWFRAAVIAVCVAGAVILALLVMLALRMLRSENKRLQRRHEQMVSRLQYSFQEPSTEKVLVGNLDGQLMVATGREQENCSMVLNPQRPLDPYAEKLGSFIPWDVYSGHRKPMLV